MATFHADALTITETHDDGTETKTTSGVWSFESADDLEKFMDEMINKSDCDEVHTN